MVTRLVVSVLRKVDYAELILTQSLHGLHRLKNWFPMKVLKSGVRSELWVPCQNSQMKDQ